MKAQIIIFLVILAGILSAHYPAPTLSNEELQNALIEGIDAVIQQAQVLKDKSVDVPTDFEAYLELRKRFKRVEFILAFVDVEFYNRFLNGAPLPKLEKNVPELSVLPPQGLQVLDEMMGSRENMDPRFIDELSTWGESLETIKMFLMSTRLTDDMITQAVQFQLIRLYTLGITGFDTPGTQNGVKDAQNTLNGMIAYLDSWHLMPNGWLNLCKKAERYIQNHSEFESFDRLDFYMNYWQPMYQSWLQVHVDEKYDRREAQGIEMEVNRNAVHLFSPTFFNIRAFIDFDPLDLNPKVVDLGRQLFSEVRLSKSKNLSCGSCHHPDKGFADGKKTSLSADGLSHLLRNSPGLVNAVYSKGYFYDLRAKRLSMQLEHVIFNENEFNSTLVDILNFLVADTSYAQAFADAFPTHGHQPVNPYTLRTSLAAYTASLQGFQSRFDQYMRGESNKLNPSEKQGFNLFMGKAGCGTCHFAPTFAGLVPPFYNETETEVLGVPTDTSFTTLDPDLGRYSPERIKETVDFYRNSFKTTTVRNVSQTPPYMHNGVFGSLKEVIEFYNGGGGLGRGLNVDNQTLSGDSLHLTTHDVEDLEAFMNSLTENRMELK